MSLFNAYFGSLNNLNPLVHLLTFLFFISVHFQSNKTFHLIPNPLCLQPISLAVCYWNAKDEKNNHLLDEKHFPVVIAKNLEKKEYFFALPDTDYPGAIKVNFEQVIQTVILRFPVGIRRRRWLGRRFESSNKKQSRTCDDPRKLYQRSHSGDWWIQSV